MKKNSNLSYPLLSWNWTYSCKEVKKEAQEAAEEVEAYGMK